LEQLSHLAVLINKLKPMKKSFIIIILASLQMMSIAQTITTLRADGTMLKNGEPFFPVGFYAESFNTLDQNNYAANTLAAAGFNVMFTEHDIAITQNEFGIFLDNCASKGIYNIISFWDPSTAIDDKMRSFIPVFKNKPSVIIWAIADDASTLGSESDILRKHNLAVSLDPNHLTRESFNGPIRETALATVGQSGRQAYPKFLSGDLMDGYGTWQDFVELVTKCNANGKTPIAHLQTYKWTTGNFIYPSAAECDVQSYLAIIAGMRGIEYYTFKDGTGSTINLTQPNLWNAAVNVSNEINGTLKNILLNGTRAATANTIEHVYYAKWIYNNETYIIVVNADQIAHGVSIPVSGNTVTNVFNYRPSTLSLNSNLLSGMLGPLQTQIYKVTNGTSTTTFSGVYTITARHSGLVLDVEGAATTNGTRIQQFTPNNTDAQKWLIEATSDGYYKLTAACSNKVLDVRGISTASGEIVHQWEYVNGDNQQWKIENLQNGFYKLTAKHSNQSLTVSDANNNAGASIIQNPWNGEYNQQWNITVDNNARISNNSSAFSISPNPAKSFILLTYPKNEAGPSIIMVTDLQGKVLLQKQLLLQQGINTATVNISNLQPGMYVVNIRMLPTGKQKSIKLFVK
jgi:Ricin-type beta-trefoil lectin domain-like/Secretion system C-terminal sorting domain